MIFRILLFSFVVLLIIPIAYWYSLGKAAASKIEPVTYDDDLQIEMISDGLEYPTSMAFLDENDILITEKDKGTVQRLVNGRMLDKPILDVAVANQNERGMLGIAISEHAGGPTYVYLYFTESPKKDDGVDYCPKIIYCEPGNDPLGNRLYRYELVSNKLVNPRLLLNLPATPGSDHNGGSLAIGPDNNLYVVVGDLSLNNSQISNVAEGVPPDGRAGIIRVTQDGQVVRPTILGDVHPLDMYYAYGIRNSFGIDFDPVTGKLWDTENGPDYGDEINLVDPGFNSGWKRAQGMWEREEYFGGPVVVEEPDNLVDFGGKGKYSNPEFTWTLPVGLTSIEFLDSDKLGKEYENDMLVADIHNGNIYRFELNAQRTELTLDGDRADRVADTDEEYDEVLFASGFNGITDIEVGPDGYLYVLAYHERTERDRTHYYGQGAVYRILP